MSESIVVGLLATVGSLLGALLAGWLAWRRALDTEHQKYQVEAYTQCIEALHNSRRANIHRAKTRKQPDEAARAAARGEAHLLKAGADAAIARALLLVGSGHLKVPLDAARKAVSEIGSDEREGTITDANEQAKKAIEQFVESAREDLMGRGKLFR